MRAESGPSRPGATSARSGPVIAGALTSILLLLLYVCTTRSVVASADNAEFQTMAATGGIAHAGYPTFVLALRAFGRLAWSTFAFRANLLGCVCGALAAGLAAFHGARISGRAWTGVSAGLALGLSYQLWQSSTVAEIYAFTLALAACLLLLARRLARRPSWPVALATGVLAGLGIGSHLTILALAPALLLALAAAWKARPFPRAVPIALLAGFVIGLAPLGYFIAQDRPDQPMNYLAAKLLPGPARAAHPARSLGESASRVVDLLSGRQYMGSPRTFRGPRGTIERFRYVFLDLVLNEFFVFGLPLAAFGAWRLARRRDLDGALLATWMAACLGLIWYAAVLYDMAATYFIYGSWILAVAMSVGLVALAEHRRWFAWAAAAGLVLAPIVRTALPRPFVGEWATQAWARLPGQWSPWTEDRSWEQYARGVMGALPPRAVLLSNWTEGMTMNYAHFAARMRPDVDIVLTENARELADYAPGALALGRPCLTTLPFAPAAEMPGLHVTAAGDWQRGGLWAIAPAARDSLAQAPPGGR